LSSHKKIEISTKSCETVRDEISNGKNPYQDWETLAVGDQWKRHLSLTATGDADINHAKKDIDAHGGEDGVTWVQGTKDNDGSIRAGGKSQPSIHVIADTVKAGFNVMLKRDLQSENDASSSEMGRYFKNPRAAMEWMTSVVGDQAITTCNDDHCKKAQGSVVGGGLLPWVTSCQADSDNCSDTIRDELGKLVTGNEPVTKANLLKVSADEIVMSPEVIAAIRRMDSSQQIMIIDKLSQEVSLQRVMNKALIARDILGAGAQVPAIAANHPAQAVIGHAIKNLDDDIRSLAFERQIRRQTISSTISETLKFENQQQQDAMRITPVTSSMSLMENGAIQQESTK